MYVCMFFYTRVSYETTKIQSLFNSSFIDGDFGIAIHKLYVVGPSHPPQNSSILFLHCYEVIKALLIG